VSISQLGIPHSSVKEERQFDLSQIIMVRVKNLSVLADEGLAIRKSVTPISTEQLVHFFSRLCRQIGDE